MVGAWPNRVPIIVPVPRPTASLASPPPIRPTIRLIQPRRSELPGAASSISSMAAKWLRLGEGRPTAWTAPNVPAFHIGSRGARLGCRPNMSSRASSWFLGTEILGRAG